MERTSWRGTGILVALVLVLPCSAQARSERLRWTHAEASRVESFQVHWGYASRDYVAIINVGTPKKNKDGVYRYDLVVPNGADVYVAVRANGSEGPKSGLSNEQVRERLPDPEPPTGGSTSGTGGGSGGSGSSGNPKNSGGSNKNRPPVVDTSPSAAPPSVTGAPPSNGHRGAPIVPQSDDAPKTAEPQVRGKAAVGAPGQPVIVE